MRRVSLKTVLYAVFGVWGVVYLSGCVNPVDLTSFVEDEEVSEIIEKSAGTVILTFDSSSGLKAGNQKITGLDPGKYYMVEEWSENGDFLSVQFVSSGGTRSANLASIGSVSKGEITGLTNRCHYRVKAAGPLPGDVSYSALTPPSGTQSAPNLNGAITLPGPTDNSVYIYSLSPPASPPFPLFDIAEIPISPAGSVRPASRSNDNIITLINRETVFDYVFFGTIGTTDIVYNFFVLKVASGEDLVPGELAITVTLSSSIDDNSPVLTPTSISYAQNDSGTITFTVSDADQYDNNSFVWYIDGTKVAGTGSSFILDESLPEYKVVGRYIITVEASKDGIPYYSAAIEVEVTP